MRRHLLLPLLAVAACGPGQQPPPPVTELRTATDSLTLSDVELTDARWLGGDRWAILAPQAKTVRIVDFGRHTATALGRPGTDYREPYAIFRAGDSLYVDDWGMRRTTAWSLDGKFAAAFDPPAPFRGVLPRARDANGAWYAELRPFPGSDGKGNLDSGVVVRWAGSGASDTVAHLAPYAMEQVNRNGDTRWERLILSGADLWDVMGDGTFWLARVNENALERCPPAHAACTSGPRLPDHVLEVTIQDREYFMQSYPPEQRSLAEGLPFTIVKPAFDAAFTDALGRVWLQQSRDLTDTTRSYRLLGLDGMATQEYRIKNAERIVGADSSHVIAIDPLVPGPGHRVLRYALPK